MSVSAGGVGLVLAVFAVTYVSTDSAIAQSTPTEDDRAAIKHCLDAAAQPQKNHSREQVVSA
jgi:hypothetical protein